MYVRRYICTRPKGKARSHALRRDAKRVMTIRRHARALSMSADRIDSWLSRRWFIDLFGNNLAAWTRKRIRVPLPDRLNGALSHFVNSLNDSKLFTIVMCRLGKREKWMKEQFIVYWPILFLNRNKIPIRTIILILKKYSWCALIIIII